MISIITILTCLYIVIAFIYLYHGFYLLYIGGPSNLNKLFFFNTVALAIWSFSFAISFVIPDISVVVLWRRVAALGWSLFYALMLHFFLVLIERSGVFGVISNRIKRFRTILLYIPALISAYVFSISTQLANQNHSMIFTTFGWRNMVVGGYWDTYFNIYYLTYSLLGLALILVWSIKTKLIREKRQATLILSSFIFAFLLGSLTDVVMDYRSTILLPEIGVALLLIPIIAIWYAIKKYGLVSLTPSFIAEDMLLHMNDAVILLDHNLVIQTINPSGLLMLEKDESELINQSIETIFCIDSPFKSLNRPTLDAVSFTSCEQCISTKDDVQKFVLFSSAPIQDNWGGLLGVVCILSDLSELKKRENALKQAQEELEQKVLVRTQEISDINRVLNREIESRNVLSYLQLLVSEISTSFIAMNQHSKDERLFGMLIRIGTFLKADWGYVAFYHKEHQKIHSIHHWNAQTHGTSVFNPQNDHAVQSTFPWTIEELLARESMIAIPLDYSSNLSAVIGFEIQKARHEWGEEEISTLRPLANIVASGLARVERENEIAYLAHHDQLTTLPNHLSLIDTLSNFIKNHPLQALDIYYLDLDSFKRVNDIHGRTSGDMLLRTVSKQLQSLTGSSSFIARIGEDEFVIIRRARADVDAKERNKNLIAFAKRIQTLFKTPFHLEKATYLCTTSIGIANYPLDGNTAEELIKSAEAAMYEAKRNGKNQYRLCTPEQNAQLRRENNIINHLQEALSNNEFELLYQPQVSLKTGRVVGAEALIRWRSSELGLMLPSVFIPLVEQIDLINQVGDWVLNAACKQNYKWQQMGYATNRMAVNLSLIQFRQPDFVYKVATAINNSGIKPNLLELEITESAAMSEPDHVISTLNALKTLGVKIAIDDFGTAYSSLSRIKTLPIDRIKIDREFILGLPENQQDQAVTKTIILLGKMLNLELIAEGVETLEQINFLQEQNCDEVQGYYYYKPVTAEEYEAILRNQEANL